MAKKIKKTTINGRSREKIRRMCIRLDKVSAALLGLAGISLALIWNQPYDLATTEPSGFPALFLLVLAGLPLELLEGVFRFIDQPELVRICGSFTMLGGGAFFTVILLWGVSRWVILRRYGLSGVKIAISLIRILVLWGIFQICCFLAASAFEDSSDDAVKQHMKHDASKSAADKK
ncbi:MAG: hypothetical protein J6R00_01855 [Lentisphaeria bacterium]|jgi:hypothetical protein|nr:hypothetical protein [Lentisphaeria bacterium]MBO5990368.1 hypothetical protein [Lentisphaeria bacterium]MBO7153305.1 hypothetical protein [Lentisphaeria bacterium]